MKLKSKLLRFAYSQAQAETIKFVNRIENLIGTR